MNIVNYVFFISNPLPIAMKNKEIELRSFIDEHKYYQLIDFFEQHAIFLKEDSHITHYFTGPYDLKMQKNNSFTKVWVQKITTNKHYQEQKETIEIHFDKEEFEQLEQLFIHLWYEIEITRFRKRLQFDRNWISVHLDYTKWFGYILELKTAMLTSQKDETIRFLQQKFFDLEVPITSQEEFQKHYERYKANRKMLIANDDRKWW